MAWMDWRRLLEDAWRATAGDLPAPAEVQVEGEMGLPASHLVVGDAAIACTGAALLAAAALSARRRVSLDAAALANAYRSEQFLQVAGRPIGAGFAPLSRFWRAADGWVRTHANYPWHRAALVAALGTAEDPAEVAAGIASLPAGEIEERVFAHGGIAAAVRAAEAWSAHHQGTAVSRLPLVGLRRADAGAPREVPPGALPLTGVRVLDLTRVIAGPVCTRFLAALGAEVLRVDPPHRPELPLHAWDGLLGKRSALLDAATAEGLEHLHRLLAGADVLVLGYRPDALTRFGLSFDALAERHPGLVVVSLSAWGAEGPWGGRRGFDSIVQAATGIALRESPDGDHPGALPCQLLDHGTGYLCAAAAVDGLRRQRLYGGTWLRELSLARTAKWLLDQPARAQAAGGTADSARGVLTVESAEGPVTTIAPPGALDGTHLQWPGPLRAYGADRPEWTPLPF